MPPKVHTSLPKGEGHHGEQRLAAQLLAFCDDKTHLWFGLHVPGGNEIDLLLLHEDVGAFVVEVKAVPIWAIASYDLKACVIDGRTGDRPPVKQAYWAMTKLRDFLRDVGVPWPPFFFAVAGMPRISRAEMCERFAAGGIAGSVLRSHFDALLFSDDLNGLPRLLSRLRAIAKSPPVGSCPRNPVPKPEQVRDLIEATTGRVTSVAETTKAIGDRQFAVAPRSSRREVIKRYVKPANRTPVILRGYAGTGKTQALLDIAVSHADEGRLVLFTCYNKVLATSLRASMAVRDVPVAVRDSVLVKDVYDIRKGIRDEGLDALENSFGTICVDEAQDMADGDLNFVARLAAREAEWFYADGPGQELYGWPSQANVAPQRLVAARDGGVTQQLNRQFRTSSPAELFAFGVVECKLDVEAIPKWVSERPIKREESALDLGIGAGRGLPEIQLVPMPVGTVERQRAVLLDSYVNAIHDELQTLRALGAAGDLMIMLPKKAGETVALVREALDVVGEPYVDQIDDENRRLALPDGHVRLVTVHSARGVTATRALLFGIHEHTLGGTPQVPPPVVNRNTGYIALTRARHGTRIILVEGNQESQFGRFVVELHRAYSERS